MILIIPYYTRFQTGVTLSDCSYAVAVNAIGIFYSFLQFVLAMVHGHSDESSEELAKFNLYSDQVHVLISL